MKKIKNLKTRILKSKTSGITLIALVVTIIVLLILAGISIAMLTGNNGILERATEARNLTDSNQIKERIQLAELSAKVDGKGILTYSKLNEELTKEFGAKGTGYDISDETEEIWTVTVANVEYDIDNPSSQTPTLDKSSGLWVDDTKVSNYGSKEIFQELKTYIESTGGNLIKDEEITFSQYQEYSFGSECSSEVNIVIGDILVIEVHCSCMVDPDSGDNYVYVSKETGKISLNGNVLTTEIVLSNGEEADILSETKEMLESCDFYKLFQKMGE